jgi:hypothetical protein
MRELTDQPIVNTLLQSVNEVTILAKLQELKAEFSRILMNNRSRRLWRVLLWVAGLGLLFAIYTSGLSQNPPGFYMDESVTAYNAYLVAHTGAGELGPRFPLFFEVYRDGFVQYFHPVEEYLLAIVFLFLPPSILLVRMYDAFLVFSACLLLGLLARRISGKRTIGVIVAAMALLTPWLFEVGRVGWEVHLVPLLTVLYLHAVYRAHGKEKWSLLDISLLVGALALLTYCYASGRVLGPLMAAGLVFFATTRRRVAAVATTWLLYGLTLVPIYLFSRSHPGALMKRFNEVTYIRPGMPVSEIASQFVKRFLEDQGLTSLLLLGDVHPRHHVQGSGGAFFIGVFVLAMIGLFIVIARRRCDPWWRFVLYGLAAAVVPGAISTWLFHSSRLVALPVFLLLLTVPALEWLLARDRQKSTLASAPADDVKPLWDDRQPLGAGIAEGAVPRSARLLILCSLLAFTGVETYWFQTVYRREGPKRLFEFDAPYKQAYDVAVKQPVRPIYLEDGRWGPAYVHALWYATLEKRPTSQFANLKPGTRPPAGSVVISTADTCERCETIVRAYVYHVYKSL